MTPGTAQPGSLDCLQTSVPVRRNPQHTVRVQTCLGSHPELFISQRFPDLLQISLVLSFVQVRDGTGNKQDLAQSSGCAGIPLEQKGFPGDQYLEPTGQEAGQDLEQQREEEEAQQDQLRISPS